MAVNRIWDYLTGDRGGKLPGHAKDELIWANDEIERLRAAIALALDRLDASRFTNAEHAQAKAALLAAKMEGKADG